VREPAEGFFIGGSSIKEMNGVYKRVSEVPSDIKHKFQLAYRKWPVDEHDDMRGWHLGLVDAPGEGANYQAVGGKRSEWLFIDTERKDRFGHPGETIIPGSGVSWEHLHRSQGGQPGEGSGNQVMQARGDDEDELPWQVIFIGDAAMVENLRHHHRYHERTQQQALIGSNLPFVPDCGETNEDGSCKDDVPVQDFTIPEEATRLFEDGEFERAAEVYHTALQGECADCHSDLSKDWRDAVFRRLKARSLRRSKKYPEALLEIAAALRRFPRYKDAHFELGLTLLDAGYPRVAVASFERLLHIDRKWPQLDEWLTRSQVFMMRDEEMRQQMQSVPQLESADLEFVRAMSLAMQQCGFVVNNEPPSTADHYTFLGVNLDHSVDELKKAYKRLSKVYHPDRQGGSNSAFQRVALAYETLIDEQRRRQYNLGNDLKRPIMQDGSEGPPFHERVERHYFPEHFDFLPFGDPFERKRQLHEERKQRQPLESNQPDVPPGSYMGSCHGCRLVSEGRRLHCTQCMNTRGERVDSSILLSDCSEEEHVGNADGRLTCEKKPAHLLNAGEDHHATEPGEEISHQDSKRPEL